jgi:hypothetical protein
MRATVDRTGEAFAVTGPRPVGGEQGLYTQERVRAGWEPL